MEASKRCIGCKEGYPVSTYHSDGRGGRVPRCKTCHRKKFKEGPRYKWKQYARDAKRRNIDFLLSEEEFKSFSGVPCFYCGGEVFPIRLDRIDNSLGYDISNVVSCCHPCNSFKHTYTEERFLKHVRAIYLYQQEISDMEEIN